jgi:hypothetical protein
MWAGAGPGVPSWRPSARSNVRGIFAAVLVTVAFVCACGGGGALPGVSQTSGGGQTVDPAFTALAGRSLNLPSASNGECPLTTAELRSPTEPFTIGDGPVYTSGVGSSSLLNLNTRGDWLVGTLSWTADRSFAEKALVRGERIDEEGQMGFGLTRPTLNVPDRLAVELDPALELPRSADVDFSWSAEVFVKAAGCYALQIDGEDFTDVVVFRAEVRS